MAEDNHGCSLQQSILVRNYCVLMTHNAQISKCVSRDNQQSKPIDLAYAKFTQDSTASVFPLMALHLLNQAFSL